MTDRSFQPDRFEPKWQQYWEDRDLFSVNTSAPVEEKYYCLVMFPYPSGKLHVGHGRNYILADALVRYQTMNEKTVLSPIGWDAFGLPAENAAIEHDVHPQEWTRNNIETMRHQLERWGLGYDWDREVTSCDPEYYRWTQWLFLQMFKEDLAYREEERVNWCDQCNTVLANEQVVDGLCERCSCEVGYRELDQWFLGITEYAQDLLDDLEQLEEWPEEVREMQRNWIGRSEGAMIQFTVAETGEILPCFTTRPDTLYGVTFMALAPEHPVVEDLAERSDRTEEILSFVEQARRQSIQERTAGTAEKEGMFLDAHAVHPITEKEVPLWVANYAVMEYGTGAVMAVPAHDQRDFEFAKEYDLDILPVIQPPAEDEKEDGDQEETLSGDEMEEAYEGEGTLINSGSFDGLPSEEGGREIVRKLRDKNRGEEDVQYRLEDWLISRQRYWGTPIPIVHCDECGTVPVPEEELPVELPEVEDFKPTGESPLARNEEFVNTSCPECGEEARRETDTMDTFVDSSWYFLRYINPGNSNVPWDREDANRWMPVDKYIGGVEHAVLHLLYARFVTKFLKDTGWVECDEPFASLFTQGMIYRDAHRCPECRKWVAEEDLETPEDGEQAVHEECGTAVDTETTKMSKSKNNSISPDDLIAEYGADVERLYTLFMAPPEKDAEWDDEAISGCDRFLRRLWKFVNFRKDTLRGASPEAVMASELEGEYRDLFRKTHTTIRDVTEDMEERFQPNTAIAKLMELLNELRSVSLPEPGGNRTNCMRYAAESLVKMVAPFAPHTAEEMWQMLGRSPSIFEHEWPRWVEKYTKADEIEIVIQIDGEVRSKINVDPDLDEDVLRAKVIQDERVQEALDGEDPRRMIVVPGKLVNVVTG